MPKIPKPLSAGDSIRLIAPASMFDPELVQLGIKFLENMGFSCLCNVSYTKRAGLFSASDKERAEQLSQALQEPDSQAVWCIRGGYGSIRLLEQLESGEIAHGANKLLIGFSDVTTLLLARSLKAGIVSIHGPVVTQLCKLTSQAKKWTKRLVTSRLDRFSEEIPLGRLATIYPGQAKGRLLAGNLTVLSSLVGTGYLPSLRNTILCIEDVSEPAYRLDRTWTQLRLSGALDGVRGIVLGSLANCLPERGKLSARSVLKQQIKRLRIPAVWGATFGHINRNIAIPIGLSAVLDATNASLRFSQG